jgi:hypothetical protein
VDNQSALEAANQALSGRTPKPMTRVAASDLSFNATSGGWELAAMASVALATVLAVVGLWLL